MAKNMTRKGLGLGAALSVVAASLVVAGPAQASNITLAPDSGTEYRVPISESFELKSRFGTGDNTYDDDFTVFVSDADENLGAVEWDGIDLEWDEDLEGWTGDTAADLGEYVNVVLTPADDLEDTFSVTVQTGFDFADGEFAGATGPVREVFFHIADDYTWNLTVDQPYVGDAALTASVTTTPALNLSQIGANVKVAFGYVDTDNDDALTALGDAEVSDDVLRIGEAKVDDDSTATKLAYSLTEDVAAQTYVASVTLGDEPASELMYVVVADATVDAITAPELVASADTDADDNIRAEADSFEVSVDASLDGDAVSGAEVTFTVAEGANWGDDAVLSIGADELATGDDALEVTVKTDADGTATLAIDMADFEGDETITITASIEEEEETTTFTFVATAADALVDNNIVGENGDLKVAAGSSYSLSYAALDNFGQPLSGDYYVRLTNGTTVKQAKVSNGVASFALTDSTTVTEDYSATLWTVDDNGVDFVQVEDFEVDTTPVVGTSNAAKTVTAVATPDEDAALLLGDMDAADERKGDLAPSAADADNRVAIAGAVTDASGLRTWSTVTLSAPGVLFSAQTPDGLRVYEVGSITVHAKASNGTYAAEAYSNTAGEVTITVTAGAASEEVDVVFVDAEPDTGASLVIDAPVAVAPGSTVIATATLTDEYGNPVAADEGRFAVAYDGPGLAVVTPSEYDANGEAKIAYFLGANDSGTITVTFSYSTEDDDDFTGDDDIVVQKTIYIGAAPSAEVATWTKNLGDGTVKMYAKNIVGAGKVQFMLNGEEIAWVRAVDATDPKLRAANGFYYLVRTVELVEGQKNALEIYVDGERTTRTAYTY